MSELNLFMDIALPILVILSLSILITATVSRTLGGWLASIALLISLVVWLGYLDVEYLAISGLFIGVSIWLALHRGDE